MADLDDIHQGIINLITTKITQANDVVLSYRDERVDDHDDDSFPRVLVTLFDTMFDNSR